MLDKCRFTPERSPDGDQAGKDYEDAGELHAPLKYELLVGLRVVQSHSIIYLYSGCGLP